MQSEFEAESYSTAAAPEPGRGAAGSVVICVTEGGMGGPSRLVNAAITSGEHADASHTHE